MRESLDEARVVHPVVGGEVGAGEAPACSQISISTPGWLATHGVGRSVRGGFTGSWVCASMRCSMYDAPSGSSSQVAMVVSMSLTPTAFGSTLTTVRPAMARTFSSSMPVLLATSCTASSVTGPV